MMIELHRRTRGAERGRTRYLVTNQGTDSLRHLLDSSATSRSRKGLSPLVKLLES